jgi:hypothetical protein
VEVVPQCYEGAYDKGQIPNKSSKIDFIGIRGKTIEEKARTFAKKEKAIQLEP